MKRPFGVSIISILFLVAGALFLGALMVAVLRPSVISVFHNPGLREDIQNASTYRGAHVLLALTFAGMGLGLWYLQRWARWLALLITGIGLFWDILMLALSTVIHEGKYQNRNFFWFATFLDAAIFVYLRLSHVRRAFTRSEVY